MVLTRRKIVLMLSSLLICSLTLVLIALFSPAQRTAGLFVTILFLQVCTLGTLILYYFIRGKATEQDYKELEQHLHFLVQHIKDYAIFLIDPKGRVMTWNKGAEHIKGYTETEIVGQPISVFYTDEDNRLGEPLLNLQRALEEGRYESVGLRKRKDGSVFYANVVFTPIFDHRNTLKGFAKITRDITDQKKFEEDMRGTLSREKELNELKSRFVTLASHEFKTPLSVILSSVSLIEKYPETDQQDKRLKHIHRIKSNVNNLKQILNDFLSLEKLEGGIVQNCPVETNLSHLIHEAIQDMENSLKEDQHIELHTEGTPRSIQVDSQLLRNILNNLLSNAVKYSPESTTVDCTLTYQPAAVDIHIRDRGIGIPPEEQQHLFERFFRATNTTGISGTGLCLSIVKKYLDLIGGQMRLSSIPGKGSTFTVTLPG